MFVMVGDAIFLGSGTGMTSLYLQYFTTSKYDSWNALCPEYVLALISRECKLENSTFFTSVIHKYKVTT